MSPQESNRHRINRARDMRGAWLTYERLGGDTGATVRLADMLADLMHWAKANRVDFEHELSLATDFYGDELEEAALNK
jgi:hypothetical protein